MAWSPNGKYLAETSGQINIWDTTSWQQLATFGKVQTSTPDSGYYYPSVTWSPDSSMLASIRELAQINPPTPPLNFATISGYNQLDVWQLSSGSGTASPSTPTSATAIPTSPQATPAVTSTVTPTTSGTPSAAPTSTVQR